MTRRSIIAGTGAALPARKLSNDELAAWKNIDTTDEWIVERTGIRTRHIAGEGETTGSLAADAAREALKMAGIEADRIGLIVLATATPDQTFPATATTVQTMLGIDDCIAFDVAAVCTGFLYALSVADNMLKGGMAEHALVIGAETFSRILDWEDRTTCVLFGDGAGAVVLSAVEGDPDSGILASRLHADGRHNQLLYVTGGPSTTQTVGTVRMKGKEVFRHAVVNLAEVMNEVLDASGRDKKHFEVIAFNYDVMKQGKELMPEIRMHWLVAPKKNQPVPSVEEMIAKAKAAKVDGLNLSKEFPIDQEFAKKIKDAGLNFYVWTVNDAEHAQRLVEAGVEGIATDRPGWLRAKLQE